MLLKYFFIFFFVLSCAGLPRMGSPLKDVNTFYTFQDGSGRYFLKKEIKHLDNKLVSRSRIYSLQQPDKELEKSVTASVIKEKQVHPVQSSFSIWFNKKENKSIIKIDRKENLLLSRLVKPVEKEIEQFDFPSSIPVCFYGQLIECLYLGGNLEKAMSEEINIMIIWDGYPFYQELYEGMVGKVYSRAMFKLEEKTNKEYKFQLNLDSGQMIVYFLDKDLKLDRMFWIAQGISMIRQERR